MTNALIWVENSEKLRFGYDWNGCNGWSKPSHCLFGMGKKKVKVFRRMSRHGWSLLVVRCHLWWFLLAKLQFDLVLWFPHFSSPFSEYMFFKSRFGYFPSLASFPIWTSKIHNLYVSILETSTLLEKVWVIRAKTYAYNYELLHLEVRMVLPKSERKPKFEKKLPTTGATYKCPMSFRTK